MGLFEEGFFETDDFTDMAKTEFELFDEDKSGFIEISELKECLGELSVRLEETLSGAGRVLIYYFYHQIKSLDKHYNWY